MEKLLPYEEIIEAKKDDLLLPNKDLAWVQMEQLLNKKKDDGILVPPPFFNWGCLLWVLPLVIIGGIGTWYYNKDLKNKNTVITKKIENVKEENKIVQPDEKNNALIENESKELENTNKEIRQAQIEKKTLNNIVDNNLKVKEYSSLLNKELLDNDFNLKLNKNKLNKVNPEIAKTNKNGGIDNEEVVKDNSKVKTKQRSIIDDNNSPVRGTPPETVKQKGKMVHLDDTTNKGKKIENLSKKQTIVTLENGSKKQVSKKQNLNKFYYGVGFNMHQPLPLRGVLSNNFNYYGRQNGIADYLPSLNFRIYNKNKWFVNIEGRFGAPQNNKPFVFLNTIKIDSNNTAAPRIAFANYTLEKTFYHQLSLSYHYNIGKSFNIGAGVTYNNFFGAIANKTGRVVIQGRQDSIIPKTILGNYPNPDTSFNKSSFQALLELQYRRNKWTLGLKYTIGLTPYIKYYDQMQNAIIKKKHENLNIVLRYELWTSKKKK